MIQARVERSLSFNPVSDRLDPFRSRPARPLRGLPSLSYALLYRAEVLGRESIASLREAILSSVGH